MTTRSPTTRSRYGSSSRINKAVNGWTASIRVATTGMDHRAAMRKTSWSSYTGTSENAADDTTTAPRPSDVMNRDGPGGKGASLQSRLSAYSRRPRAHVVDQVALQFGPVGHLVGEVPLSVRKIAKRRQRRGCVVSGGAQQRRPGHQ